MSRPRKKAARPRTAETIRMGNEILFNCRHPYGDAARVNELIAKGATLDEGDDGGTSLVWAAWHGHSRMVRALIDAGANVEARDTGNNTALHAAAAKTQSDIVKMLIEAGADIHARGEYGETPLMHAVKGPVENLRLLLEAGADPNELSDTGRTACDLAIKHMNRRAAKYFKEYGEKNRRKTFNDVTKKGMAIGEDITPLPRIRLKGKKP